MVSILENSNQKTEYYVFCQFLFNMNFFLVWYCLSQFFSNFTEDAKNNKRVELVIDFGQNMRISLLIHTHFALEHNILIDTIFNRNWIWMPYKKIQPLQSYARLFSCLSWLAVNWSYPCSDRKALITSSCNGIAIPIGQKNICAYERL